MRDQDSPCPLSVTALRRGSQLSEHVTVRNPWFQGAEPAVVQTPRPGEGHTLGKFLSFKRLKHLKRKQQFSVIAH